MRDYPAAIVSCADSWRNYMDYVTESSGKANALSYKKTPVLESALLTLGDIGTTNRLQELYWSLCRTPCGKNCDDDCKCS